jgi:hypothetical protein
LVANGIKRHRSGFVPITSPPTPVPTVDEDQLALLLAELDRLGHPYHPVAIVPNLDAQAPSSTGKSVRITDRTVILARGGDDIKLSNAQVQEFLAISAFPSRLAARTQLSVDREHRCQQRNAIRSTETARAHRAARGGFVRPAFIVRVLRPGTLPQQCLQ